MGQQLKQDGFEFDYLQLWQAREAVMPKGGVDPGRGHEVVKHIFSGFTDDWYQELLGSIHEKVHGTFAFHHYIESLYECYAHMGGDFHSNMKKNNLLPEGADLPSEDAFLDEWVRAIGHAFLYRELIGHRYTQVMMNHVWNARRC